MFHMKKILTACALFVSLFSLKAHAVSEFGKPTQSYEYWVRVPATQVSCQVEAELLAKRFSTLTHLPVKTASCRAVVDAHFDGNLVRLYSLALTYEATEPASLYRASVGGVTDPSSADSAVAGFSQYAECLAHVSKQANFFEVNTGLLPFVAYCEPARNLGSIQYVINIEGFGEPKLRLFSFNLEATVFQKDFDPSLNQSAIRFLRSFGAEIIHTEGDVSYYYGKPGIFFNQMKFGHFARQEDCVVQEDTVRSILKSSGVTREMTQCVFQESSKGFLLYSLSGGNRLFLMENRVGTNYYSLTECLEDRSRILSKYVANAPEAGAICREDSIISGVYQMTVYTR